MNEHVWSLTELLAWAERHGSEEDVRKLIHYQRLKADRRIWSEGVSHRIARKDGRPLSPQEQRKCE